MSSLPLVPYDIPDKKLWNGIVLVGEAPGADEVKLGHPFVGRSGQLLNDILNKAGVDRSTCLVANVFRFQPPKNKIDHFFISKRSADQQNVKIAEKYGKFGSAWCRAEFAKEIDNLGKTLDDWRPRIIVALGRTPLWALTGENGLLDKVGSTLNCRLAQNIKVMPTFHPSYILRGNWSKQPDYINHIKAAMNESLNN